MSAQQPFNPSTPEDALIPDPRLRGCDVAVDAALCLTARMRALVDLLHADGESDRPGFTLRHGTILNALWLLSGLLEQLDALLMASGPLLPGEQQQ